MRHAALLFLSVLVIGVCADENTYPWQPTSKNTIVKTIATPRGCMRVKLPGNSYGNWLRGLPLKPAGSKVLAHTGQAIRQQGWHEAVIDIDVGRRNLQQCADTLIRFRAEYLFSKGKYSTIHFNFTSGDTAYYSKWRQGYRPAIAGNRVNWRKTVAASSSYSSFRKYLDSVFMYAGTASLSKEMQRLPDVSKVRIGDVLVQGGFPGHAVVVVDTCFEKSSGQKLILLTQGFMPAQSAHIIKNLNEPRISPWYRVVKGQKIKTPGWTFAPDALRRFR